MKLHFYFQKVDPNSKDSLEHYLDQAKVNRLTRLLQHGNLELADLDITVAYMAHHNAFDVKLDLKIAKKVLFAEDKSHDILKAFDLTFDRLINQLRKVENLRHDKKYLI
mgnify:CR=1 FL=1